MTEKQSATAEEKALGRKGTTEERLDALEEANKKLTQALLSHQHLVSGQCIVLPTQR